MSYAQGRKPDFIVERAVKQFNGSSKFYWLPAFPTCISPHPASPSMGHRIWRKPLGIGFVHGVQPYVYLERVLDHAIESLGLSAHGAEEHSDVWIRIPKNRQSVFRAAVMKNGVPVSDIVQVWLDVARRPSRGKEQADLIWRRILAPAFDANEQ